MNNTELGAFGESMAERYLINKGLRIIDKNVRFKKWEVDIIAEDGEKLKLVKQQKLVNHGARLPKRNNDKLFK